MTLMDPNCKVIPQENLEVPNGKISQTIQNKQNYVEISTQNKYQRRETLMENATNLEFKTRQKPTKDEIIGD